MASPPLASSADPKAFLNACESGDVETIERVVEEAGKMGTEEVKKLVEWRDERGVTPLLVACGSGRERVVQTLLSAGVDLESADEDGRTGLVVACSKGHSRVVGKEIGRAAGGGRGGSSGGGASVKKKKDGIRDGTVTGVQTCALPI